MRVLLLPGMDGTGRLFDGFRRALSPRLKPTVVAYGDAVEQDDLMSCVPISDQPTAIVAESFSGPLAVTLAASGRLPNLRAIVLVASFVRSPRAVPRWMASLLLPAMFKLTPPRALLRGALLGADAPDALVAELASALASVPPGVLAARLRAVLTGDATSAFERCPVPLLYVQARFDRLVPQSVLGNLLQRRPQLQHALLDAPHLVLQRCPEESARVVSSFLLG